MSDKQQVLFEIYLENGQFKVKAKEAEQGLSDITNETKKGTKGFKDYLKAGLAMGAVALVVRKLFDFLKGTVKEASSLNETTNKFNVVFGKVKKTAKENTKVLQEMYGHSKQGAKEMLSGTGDLLTGLGMMQDKALDVSFEVAKLGTDLASFNDYAGGAAGAVDALTKGLLGEREAMKGLGIIINEEMLMNRLRAEGKDKLTGLALSQAKAEATLALAIEQSGNAIGDSQRSAHEYANVMRRVDARMKDIKASLGEELTPALGRLGVAFLDSSKEGNGFQIMMKGIVKATVQLIKGLTAVIRLMDWAASKGRKAGAESFIKDASEKQLELLKEINKKYEEEAKVFGITPLKLLTKKYEAGSEEAKAYILKLAQLDKDIKQAEKDALGFDEKADAILDDLTLSDIGIKPPDKEDDKPKPKSGSETGTPSGEPPKADVAKYYQDIGNISQAHIQKIKQEGQSALDNAKLVLAEKLGLKDQELEKHAEFLEAKKQIEEQSRQEEVIAEATAWQEKGAAAERYYRAKLGMESALWQGTSSIAAAGTALMNEQNKGLFKVGQMSALTNVAMNTAEGITAGYKWGPFIGSANAAMLLTLGAVQAKNIAKQKPPAPAKIKKPEIEVPTLPSYAVGAWRVPTDHIAQLHKDETILPKPFAKDYREKIENGGGMQPSINVYVQGDVIDKDGLFQVIHTAQKDLERRTGSTVYSRQSVY